MFSQFNFNLQYILSEAKQILDASCIVFLFYELYAYICLLS